MGGLLGALAAAIVVLLTVGGTVDSSDSRDESAAERCAEGAEGCDDTPGGGIEPADEPGSGDGAFGICIEGTVDCVDTPAADCQDPAVDCQDTPAPGPDEPVSSDPRAPGSLPPSSGSGDGDSGTAGGIEPAVCAGTDSEECAARATELSLADLSGRLGVEAEAITFVDSEYVEWSNACLEAAPQGTVCAEVITPGYVVILKHADVEYEYRTDTGSRVVLVVDGEPAE
jgi:hypothetical protein